MGENVSAARRAAAHVLSRCRRFDAWSAQTLESAIGKYRLSERDAALCTRLCRSVLQNAAWLDYYIALYCTQNLKRLQPQVLDALRLGAAQLLLLDRVPASAAVNESVSLVRESSPRAAGLVNAVLRRLAENAAALPPVEAEGAEYLSIRYSHPLWLCERLVEERGYDFAEGFCRANNEEAPLTVTVNSLRVGGEPHSQTLDASGAVERLPGFAEGEFFVQDAAAARALKDHQRTGLGGCKPLRRFTHRIYGADSLISVCMDRPAKQGFETDFCDLGASHLLQKTAQFRLEHHKEGKNTVCKQVFHQECNDIQVQDICHCIQNDE